MLIFLAIFIPMLLVGPNNITEIDTEIPIEKKGYIGNEKRGIKLQEITW